MGFDAKKISIAFFVLLSCIIGMVILTAAMLIGTGEKIEDGFHVNDSLHSVVSHEHNLLIKQQDSIIANQKSIIKFLKNDTDR